ncbi:MAG TPA: YicC family protein [Bacteroidales bacterium]|mgnify:CR=1 FL=1|nr:YicC family protein [Bacteroidales bacterium]HPS73153.1 YicC family protein [Bacteroidales bacterium]
MIRSMTGYGKAVAEIPGRKITIEIKSLNSKQTDLNIKIPSFLRDKEFEIRSIASQVLQRGKADIYISAELSSEARPFTINRALAMKYYEELRQLQNELQEDCPEGLLPTILKMPDVLQTEKDDLAETSWGVIRAAVENALHQTDSFRSQEGKVLEDDIKKRINLILGYLSSVEPFEKRRMETLRGNLLKAFEKYNQGDNGVKADPNRFEQELIFYLEKLDFTEEKVRLKKHCDNFLEVMNEETAQGKKLGFIAQEIGREVNTLGSKANDAEIQMLVVQMKDELEKVKEQLMNIL